MSNESGRGVILMYHSITRSTLNPQYLRVDPDRFASHIQAVSETFEAVPLVTLAERVLTGMPGAVVAISFDDGYADNLEQALPILRRFGVPATIFVATGPVFSGERFWWEEVERLTLLAPAEGDELRVEVSGRRAVWKLEDELPPNGGTDAAGWRTWAEPRHWRHSLFLSLLALMRVANETERTVVLERLREVFDASRALPEVGQPLRPESLAELARDDLIEIGAHTVTHPVLALLSPAEQDTEVGECKATLESLTGQAVHAFAYPYGGLADYTGDTRRAVRQTGYTYACSTASGMVTASTDSLSIPRMAALDEDPEALIGRIAGLLRGGS